MEPRTISNEKGPRPVLGLISSISIVVASMIGTGIFTTTGFLVAETRAATPVLMMWFIGGLLALCGALSYGELAAAIPRSGGEYHFLGRVYHPFFGFLAGWVSLIVGFSAPIAASALAFGRYTSAVFPAFPPTAGAVALVILLSIMHMADVKGGSYVQNFFTLLKVLLILVFIFGGFFLAPSPPSFFLGESVGWSIFFTPGFAVGLIFVSFSYSGWNGATYVISEVKGPEKRIPVALITGTALVMLLYLLLNVVFLSAVPLSDLAGVAEVGHLAAVSLFGPVTGKILSLVISIALISSVSAMIMTGPRVYQAAGQDYSLFSILSRLSKRGTPMVAIELQAAVAIIMILTATFDKLLIYIGFTLSLATGLGVAGVVVLRHREPGLFRPYRTWGYPATPIVYVVMTLWVATYNIWSHPVESLAGAVTLGAGALLYYVSKSKEKEKRAGILS